MKRFAILSLAVLAACLPAPPAVVVGAAGVAVVHGSAQSPGDGTLGDLLSATVQPGAKVLRISAWGGGTAQGSREFHVAVGGGLPIAVNIDLAIAWFRCDVEVVRASASSAHSSAVCVVGNLAGDTRTSVYSTDFPLDWSATVAVKGLGKGPVQGSVTQTGLVVEALN